ncbi:peptide-methionine (R)-S-oxide reductase MsrB [Kiloniella majae]|uniref:peptide-methionine (R)-S-oxide reductase MsrB n=1 Tax=Kiloniella majae TaxID=1938558 RepID=UPI001FED7C6A|nr:peptide-methionine (R)-S-oxide reductase MsrB [Kiloniella majae]
MMKKADPQQSDDNDIWLNKLDEETYRVAREGGTEQAFANKYHDCNTSGTYHCICCSEPLFHSNAKYDSGSGWPSFYAPVGDGYVSAREDHSHGMHRVEIFCAKCDAHLGHVFPDGPEPTGLRYCVNSASLDLKAEPKSDK